MTVAQALREAEARLSAAGVPAPRLDAERLLRHVTGWDAARLIASLRNTLPSTAAAEYAVLVDQRARRRPLQHLTGEQAFWKHEFTVTPDVLIPRPETELLVEAALELLAGREAPFVVDVGTGSGCIAISIALERRDADVWALDVSPAALRVAAGNALRLGAERIHFLESDLLQSVPQLTGRVDLVVSNPPYVDPAEIPTLQPEVRDHEPRAALHAPEGCEALYARLAREAAALLRPGGALAVEMGMGMETPVRQAMAAAGLSVDRVIADLQQIPRIVIAR
ncbi:MAG TPA: peptide chain release factor N(5)-glutamine methyltransferase [Vicinamibacteria bacterium]|nr:peptide chain release factor N(5)-glutamine methyltransferase [Vicinamibacteria bacterium]